MQAVEWDVMPVFFCPAMVANSGCFSPSAAKPAALVKHWAVLGLPVEIIAPEPATVDQIALAHDRRYVEDVLAGRALNGFGNTSPEVAASLPYTTGAMLAAAQHALRTGEASCAPVSGFHHAGFDYCSGFCTFNGLMVTALELLRPKDPPDAKRVCIIDCDMHYGDGTDDILRAGWTGQGTSRSLRVMDGSLGEVARVRVVRTTQLRHFTAGGHFTKPSQANGFLRRLAEIVSTLARDCDVALYQAGADPHINDPLGGWLTTEQLRQRDAIVFETLAQMGVPVAWNLAGGYQVEPDGSIPKVLEIHTNTALECLRVQGVDQCKLSTGT